MFTPWLILLAAYLMGSFPTAVIVSRQVAGVDIRQTGDANMGARNAAHVLGFKYGLLIAIIDISKGALAVMLANAFGLSLAWKIGAACCSLLGHDFPIFAGFQGGQGLATLTGNLLAFAPLETLIGLSVYGLLYALVRSSNIAAASAMGLQVILMILWAEPWPVIAYAVLANLSIPLKMHLDQPRRERLRHA